MSDNELRPPMPQRPQALERKQSLSQLTIGSSRSLHSLKLSELQAQPTTEVTLESIGQALPNNDNASIYSKLSHYDSLAHRDQSFSDGNTIRSNPTLTVYSDDDSYDIDSVTGATDRDFTHRLGDLISQSDSDMRMSFLEDEEEQKFLKGAKQFFILSSAGKPIYAMNTEDDTEADEKFIGYVGILQTIVSSFLLDGSKLKSFVAGPTRFTILNQSPIILVAVSKLHETENELLNQLDLLHSFLLSTLSKPHIVRSFQNKEGFDLRKHLGRADWSGLDLLCNEITNFNAGILVGALQSIRLRKSTREKINSVLLKNKHKDLLYGILVAPGGKLINILRPKNHTLHTTDLQILFSLVFNQSKNREDEELWLPICLPKFNPNGFLYAYVKFIHGVALILMSADKNAFFEMKEVSENVIKGLEKRQLFNGIQESMDIGLSTVDIPAPLVYHFVYKSKRHLQYVMPTYTNIKNLQKYYVKLHSSVNRNNRVNVSYLKWEKDTQHNKNNAIAGLCWVTPHYELLLLTGSITKKDLLVNSAKSIVNWCRKYEERLFVCEGATF